MKIYNSKNLADKLAVQQMVGAVESLDIMIKSKPHDMTPGEKIVEAALKLGQAAITRELANVAYWKN